MRAGGTLRSWGDIGEPRGILTQLLLRVSKALFYLGKEEDIPSYLKTVDVQNQEPMIYCCILSPITPSD